VGGHFQNRARKGGTVTIETGLRCNNRCFHCPQAALRGAGLVHGEPGRAELERRISDARAAGFDEIAFSGGEPTVRRDFLELVTVARSVGFREVSVTTNGRMFAYPDFARRALEAGLTGASISLHGPDADVHESLTGTPGSFMQAVAGLDTLSRMRSDAYPDFRLCSLAVLVPGTLPHLGATLRLAGTLGARLHIVQPFILSIETLPVARRFLVDLDSILSAIFAAVRDGLLPGHRIKPFNLPLCLLEPVADRLEIQGKRLRTHREFRRTLADGDLPAVSRQFAALSACESCDLPCPGIRLEHVPPAHLARILLEAIGCHATGQSRGVDLVLAALELLPQGPLDEVIRAGRARADGKLLVTWASDGMVTGSEFREVSRNAGVDEIVVMVRWPDPRGDGLACRFDNVVAARDLLASWRPGQDPVPSLMLPLNGLLALGVDFVPLVDSLWDALRQAGGQRIRVVVPERTDSDDPAPASAMMASIQQELPDWIARWRGHGLAPVLMRIPVDNGMGGALQDAAARNLDCEDWTASLLDHPLAGPEMHWLMASDPVWMRHAGAGTILVPEFP
jgi:uncharacterized Fe-S cluster-containing radical SAM superfamily protein